MSLLIRALGLPHEALHLLALLLIGRRARRFTQTYVDIPDDLTTGQYVFVAGLPALVFVVLLALGAVGLVSAHTLGQAVLALLVALFGAVSTAGTLGDIALILAKLEGHERHQ